MAAEQMSSSHLTVEAHHHDASAVASDEHDHHSHDVDDSSDVNEDANDHCSKCTHCIACISAITSETSQDMSLDPYQALADAFVFQYVSIVIPLLQKPPISA